MSEHPTELIPVTRTQQIPVVETWETDGSPLMERASLVARVSALTRQLREAEARLAGARNRVEILSGEYAVELHPELVKQVRELRMLLNGGMAQTQTARADALVEEWLQDPHRSIFGLAADLLDVMGPPRK